MSELEIEHRFLTISGSINSAGELLLEPCFQFELADRSPLGAINESDTPTVVVEFLDARGSVLSRELVPAQPMCLEEPDPEDMWIVGGQVPFPASPRAIRYFWNDTPVLTTAIEQTTPEVTLTWRPRRTVTGIQLLTWAATRSSDQPLSYLVLYTWNGDQWRSLSLILQDNLLTVDFDDLPGGTECAVRVLASDGINTAVDQSSSFEVPIKGIQPMILQPGAGDMVLAGIPLLLTGQAYDWEGTSFVMDELSWSSSRDGALGVGATLDAKLSPGEHEIVLTEGVSGEARSTSVSIVAMSQAEFPAG